MKKDKATRKIMKKDKAIIETKSAKVRKLEAEAKRLRKEAREKEDQQWIDTKSRAAKMREEKAESQAKAAARKALNRLLAKQEEEDLETMLNLKKSNRKVTAAELQRKREEKEGKEEELQKKAEKDRRKQSRVATKKEYESTILVENNNRSVIEARSFDEAIAVLEDRENLQVTKVKATQGNKGDYLLVYTQGEKKPLLFDVLLTV